MLSANDWYCYGFINGAYEQFRLGSREGLRRWKESEAQILDAEGLGDGAPALP